MTDLDIIKWNRLESLKQALERAKYSRISLSTPGTLTRINRIQELIDEIQNDIWKGGFG